MLISLPEIVQKYNLNTKGVVQVGAHWAEEHEIYVELGIKNIVYIEPCRNAFNVLMSKFVNQEEINGVILFNYACGENEGELDMFISDNNQGQSNSLLRPMLHLEQHKEIVFTHHESVRVIALDKLSFDKTKYNLLIMDVQGAEGLVLKGATETLKHIDCIYTEVNRGQTYEGNMEIYEMDAYLSNFGFVRVETYWPSPSWTWGDAVYISYELDHFYKTGVRLNP